MDSASLHPNRLQPQLSRLPTSSKSLFLSLLLCISPRLMDLPRGLAKPLSSRHGAFSGVSFRLQSAPKLPRECRRKSLMSEVHITCECSNKIARPAYNRTLACNFCYPTPMFQLERATMVNGRVGVLGAARVDRAAGATRATKATLGQSGLPKWPPSCLWSPELPRVAPTIPTTHPCNVHPPQANFQAHCDP